MEEDRSAELYRAFASKDARFDGRFFVGVRSTGIYCRPVCRARMPKAENCVFFRVAAEAEQAGFRPCLICRPERAPGMSITDARNALAWRAARYIEENGDGSLAALAGRLGYTDRHVRRVFSEQFHVTPVAYAQTCRLLLAKGLMTDTDLSVTEVAMASGFGSLRRMNELFRGKYRLSPTGFRKSSGADRGRGVTVALGYRPPYAWDRLLAFLAPRAIPGVERIADGAYWRTVRETGRDGKPVCGWLSVRHRPDENALAVTLSDGLLPALLRTLGRVRNLFDLDCDPCAVAERFEGAPPGDFVCGLRVPGCADPFEMCVRAVLGQQISVRAASALAGKFAAAFGTPVETGVAGLTTLFPRAEDIRALQGTPEDRMGPLGVIASRARAIASLAASIAGNEIDFAFGNDPETEMAKLTRIPGIGPWTATYVAMRALGWTDAFPENDLGVRRALGDQTPKALRALSDAWRPWRSYATMALWDARTRGEKG